MIEIMGALIYYQHVNMDFLEHYVLTAVVVLVLCLSLLWAVSLKIKNASIIDIFWGMGFVLVAGVGLCLLPERTAYAWLLALLPIIWGVRLSLYLAWRNIGKGEDRRYQAMQRRAEKRGISETRWRLRALLTIFLGQGLLIVLVSAPLFWALSQSVSASADIGLAKEVQGGFAPVVQIGWLGIIGACIWGIGFMFEAVGDWQLARFMNAQQNYDGPYEAKPVLDRGLWKYTRHPNYFGNACMWWGIWLVACEVSWGWVTIFAPIIMTVLLTRISGRDLLERKLKTRPAYMSYIERTPSFFPGFPKKSDVAK